MISGKPYTLRGVRAVWEGVDARPSLGGCAEAYLMILFFFWEERKAVPETDQGKH